MSCSVFTVPPGAHTCLKSANVFTPSVVYSGSVSTASEILHRRQRILAQKNVGAHLRSAPKHLNRVYTCSLRLRRPLVIIVPFCGVWWASVNYRSPRSWPLLSPPAQMYFLTFRLGVQRAVRCTWAQWQWKLIHSPYQHPSRTKSSQVSPCLSWINSTAVHWLSCVDIAWLAELVGSCSSAVPEEHRFHRLATCWLDTVTGQGSIPHRSHRASLATLSLDTVEDLMVGEVDDLEEDAGWSISCFEGAMDVEEGLFEKELVEKPGTIIATFFLVMDVVSLLVEEVHDKSPKFFEAILVTISLISWKTVDVQWLLALVVGGNRLILQEGLLELLFVLGTLASIEVDVLRTWSHPRKFELYICGFGNCPQCGWDHFFRVWGLRRGILTRLFCPPAQGLLP